jgi:hypothetical protein
MNGSRWHFPESVVVDVVAWNRWNRCLNTVGVMTEC